MAKPNKIARYVKESHALDGASPRGAQAKPSGLYLLELRSHHAVAQSPLPKRKLVITIDPYGGPDGSPKPVKITHS
jgi:hypothetical protein